MNNENDIRKKELKIVPRKVIKPDRSQEDEPKKSGADFRPAARERTHKNWEKFKPADAADSGRHVEAFAAPSDSTPALLAGNACPSGEESAQREGQTSTPASESEGVVAVSKVFRSEDLFRLVPVLARKQVSVTLALAMVLISTIAVAVVSFHRGNDAGRAQLLREQTKAQVFISADTLAEINTAFIAMLGGKAAEAADKFASLQSRYPDLSSLTYLEALAATRAGQIDRAEKSANASMAKRERVADSLALIALIQAQRGENPESKKIGDSRLRAELLLGQSIASDVANPYPFIELAALQRRQDKPDAALVTLESASLRVQPTDTVAFINVTRELTKLSAISEWDLPDIARETPDTVSSFTAAYIALRRGNFEQAKELLKLARNQTEPALFRYLINDQALRKYAKEPGLQEFFQK